MTDTPQSDDATILPSDAIERLANGLSAKLETTVAEGVRRGRMPQFIGTARAVLETGLSARQLKHLRETSRISWRKPNGKILYDTSELFREIDRSKVPAILAKPINAETPPAARAGRAFGLS